MLLYPRGSWRWRWCPATVGEKRPHYRGGRQCHNELFPDDARPLCEGGALAASAQHRPRFRKAILFGLILWWSLLYLHFTGNFYVFRGAEASHNEEGDTGPKDDSSATSPVPGEEQTRDDSLEVEEQQASPPKQQEQTKVYCMRDMTALHEEAEEDECAGDGYLRSGRSRRSPEASQVQTLVAAVNNEPPHGSVGAGPALVNKDAHPQAEHSQGEYSQDEHSQSGRSQDEHSQGKRSQGKPAQGEPTQGKPSQGDHVHGESSQGECGEDGATGTAQEGVEGCMGHSEPEESPHQSRYIKVSFLGEVQQATTSSRSDVETVKGFPRLSGDRLKQNLVASRATSTADHRTLIPQQRLHSQRPWIPKKPVGAMGAGEPWQSSGLEPPTMKSEVDAATLGAERLSSSTCGASDQTCAQYVSGTLRQQSGRTSSSCSYVQQGAAASTVPATRSAYTPRYCAGTKLLGRPDPRFHERPDLSGPAQMWNDRLRERSQTIRTDRTAAADVLPGHLPGVLQTGQSHFGSPCEQQHRVYVDNASSSASDLRLRHEVPSPQLHSGLGAVHPGNVSTGGMQPRYSYCGPGEQVSRPTSSRQAGALYSSPGSIPIAGLAKEELLGTHGDQLTQQGYSGVSGSGLPSQPHGSHCGSAATAFGSATTSFDFRPSDSMMSNEPLHATPVNAPSNTFLPPAPVAPAASLAHQYALGTSDSSHPVYRSTPETQTEQYGTDQNSLPSTSGISEEQPRSQQPSTDWYSRAWPVGSTSAQSSIPVKTSEGPDRESQESSAEDDGSVDQDLLNYLNRLLEGIDDTTEDSESVSLQSHEDDDLDGEDATAFDEILAGLSRSLSPDDEHPGEHSSSHDVTPEDRDGDGGSEDGEGAHSPRRSVKPRDRDAEGEPEDGDDASQDQAASPSPDSSPATTTDETSDAGTNAPNAPAGPRSKMTRTREDISCEQRSINVPSPVPSDSAENRLSDFPPCISDKGLIRHLSQAGKGHQGASQATTSVDDATGGAATAVSGGTGCTMADSHWLRTTASVLLRASAALKDAMKELAATALASPSAAAPATRATSTRGQASSEEKRSTCVAAVAAASADSGSVSAHLSLLGMARPAECAFRGSSAAGAGAVQCAHHVPGASRTVGEGTPSVQRQVSRAASFSYPPQDGEQACFGESALAGGHDIERLSYIDIWNDLIVQSAYQQSSWLSAAEATAEKLLERAAQSSPSVQPYIPSARMVLHQLRYWNLFCLLAARAILQSPKAVPFSPEEVRALEAHLVDPSLSPTIRCRAAVLFAQRFAALCAAPQSPGAEMVAAADRIAKTAQQISETAELALTPKTLALACVRLVGLGTILLLHSPLRPPYSCAGFVDVIRCHEDWAKAINVSEERIPVCLVSVMERSCRVLRPLLAAMLQNADPQKLLLELGDSVHGRESQRAFLEMLQELQQRGSIILTEELPTDGSAALPSSSAMSREGFSSARETQAVEEPSSSGGITSIFPFSSRWSLKRPSSEATGTSRKRVHEDGDSSTGSTHKRRGVHSNSHSSCRSSEGTCKGLCGPIKIPNAAYWRRRWRTRPEQGRRQNIQGLTPSGVRALLDVSRAYWCDGGAEAAVDVSAAIAIEAAYERACGNVPPSCGRRRSCSTAFCTFSSALFRVLQAVLGPSVSPQQLDLLVPFFEIYFCNPRAGAALLGISHSQQSSSVHVGAARRKRSRGVDATRRRSRRQSRSRPSEPSTPSAPTRKPRRYKCTTSSTSSSSVPSPPPPVPFSSSAASPVIQAELQGRTSIPEAASASIRSYQSAGMSAASPTAALDVYSFPASNGGTGKVRRCRAQFRLSFPPRRGRKKKSVLETVERRLLKHKDTVPVSDVGETTSASKPFSSPLPEQQGVIEQQQSREGPQAEGADCAVDEGDNFPSTSGDMKKRQSKAEAPPRRRRVQRQRLEDLKPRTTRRGKRKKRSTVTPEETCGISSNGGGDVLPPAALLVPPSTWLASPPWIPQSNSLDIPVRQTPPLRGRGRGTRTYARRRLTLPRQQQPGEVPHAEELPAKRRRVWEQQMEDSQAENLTETERGDCCTTSAEGTGGISSNSVNVCSNEEKSNVGSPAALPPAALLVPPSTWLASPPWIPQSNSLDIPVRQTPPLRGRGRGTRTYARRRLTLPRQQQPGEAPQAEGAGIAFGVGDDKIPSTSRGVKRGQPKTRRGTRRSGSRTVKVSLPTHKGTSPFSEVGGTISVAEPFSSPLPEQQGVIEQQQSREGPQAEGADCAVDEGDNFPSTSGDMKKRQSKAEAPPRRRRVQRQRLEDLQPRTARRSTRKKRSTVTAEATGSTSSQTTNIPRDQEKSDTKPSVAGAQEMLPSVEEPPPSPDRQPPLMTGYGEETKDDASGSLSPLGEQQRSAGWSPSSTGIPLTPSGSASKESPPLTDDDEEAQPPGRWSPLTDDDEDAQPPGGWSPLTDDDEDAPPSGRSSPLTDDDEDAQPPGGWSPLTDEDEEEQLPGRRSPGSPETPPAHSPGSAPLRKLSAVMYEDSDAVATPRGRREPANMQQQQLSRHKDASVERTKARPPAFGTPAGVVSAAGMVSTDAATMPSDTFQPLDDTLQHLLLFSDGGMTIGSSGSLSTPHHVLPQPEMASRSPWQPIPPSRRSFVYREIVLSPPLSSQKQPHAEICRESQSPSSTRNTSSYNNRDYVYNTSSTSSDNIRNDNISSNNDSSDSFSSNSINNADNRNTRKRNNTVNFTTTNNDTMEKSTSEDHASGTDNLGSILDSYTGRSITSEGESEDHSAAVDLISGDSVARIVLSSLDPLRNQLFPIGLSPDRFHTRERDNFVLRQQQHGETLKQTQPQQQNQGMEKEQLEDRLQRDEGEKFYYVRVQGRLDPRKAAAHVRKIESVDFDDNNPLSYLLLSPKSSQYRQSTGWKTASSKDIYRLPHSTATAALLPSLGKKGQRPEIGQSGPAGGVRGSLGDSQELEIEQQNREHDEEMQELQQQQQTSQEYSLQQQHRDKKRDGVSVDAGTPLSRKKPLRGIRTATNDDNSDTSTSPEGAAVTDDPKRTEKSSQRLINLLHQEKTSASTDDVCIALYVQPLQAGSRGGGPVNSGDSGVSSERKSDESNSSSRSKGSGNERSSSSSNATSSSERNSNESRMGKSTHSRRSGIENSSSEKSSSASSGNSIKSNSTKSPTSGAAPGRELQAAVDTDDVESIRSLYSSAVLTADDVPHSCEEAFERYDAEQETLLPQERKLLETGAERQQRQQVDELQKQQVDKTKRATPSTVVCISPTQTVRALYDSDNLQQYITFPVPATLIDYILAHYSAEGPFIFERDATAAAEAADAFDIFPATATPQELQQPQQPSGKAPEGKQLDHQTQEKEQQRPVQQPTSISSSSNPVEAENSLLPAASPSSRTSLEMRRLAAGSRGKWASSTNSISHNISSPGTASAAVSTSSTAVVAHEKMLPKTPVRVGVCFRPGKAVAVKNLNKQQQRTAAVEARATADSAQYRETAGINTPVPEAAENPGQLQERNRAAVKGKNAAVEVGELVFHTLPLLLEKHADGRTSIIKEEGKFATGTHRQNKDNSTQRGKRDGDAGKSKFSLWHALTAAATPREQPHSASSAGGAAASETLATDSPAAAQEAEETGATGTSNREETSAKSQETQQREEKKEEGAGEKRHWQEDIQQKGFEKKSLLSAGAANDHEADAPILQIPKETIYTRRFIVAGWDYLRNIAGRHLTEFNRLVLKVANPTSLTPCAGFWEERAFMGAGPVAFSAIGAKPEDMKRFDGVDALRFELRERYSDESASSFYDGGYIPPAHLRTFVCFYADEASPDGIALSEVVFTTDAKEAVVVVLFVLFLVMGIPICCAVTVSCHAFKHRKLRKNLRRFYLVQQRDTIEMHLRDELGVGPEEEEDECGEDEEEEVFSPEASTADAGSLQSSASRLQ